MRTSPKPFSSRLAPSPTTAETIIDETLDDAQVRQSNERLPVYAWAALLTISASLCLLVSVAGTRAPSATPFFEAGAGGVGAGVSGMALQLAKSKVRLAPLVRAGVAIALALVVALASGGLKYTYGGTGSAAVSMTFSPLVLEHGATTPLVGEITVFNDGATTLRVLPHFEVQVTDAGGFQLQSLGGSGCVISVDAAPTEKDLVELAPGASLQRPFRLPVAWADQPGATTEYGAVVITHAGPHKVTGVFSSTPFDAFALVPVWSGTLGSESLPLDVH